MSGQYLCCPHWACHGSPPYNFSNSKQPGVWADEARDAYAEYNLFGVIHDLILLLLLIQHGLHREIRVVVRIVYQSLPR